MKLILIPKFSEKGFKNNCRNNHIPKNAIPLYIYRMILTFCIKFPKPDHNLIKLTIEFELEAP